LQWQEKAFTEDGWLLSGDVGMVLPNGVPFGNRVWVDFVVA